MGVRGLASFVQAFDSAISEICTYQAQSQASTSNGSGSSSSTRETLAVDAWAWVFEIWLSSFGESVQGGNYADVVEYVKDAIHAWRIVGLEPIFFWDGPIPLAKQPTHVARRAGIAATNSSFMRSSSQSRSSRQFQAECYSYLPLLGDTVRTTLAEEGVKSVMAVTEADGIVAEVAEKKHGLAASKDSDFFILCSRGAGKARYTPVDTFTYITKPVAALSGQGTETTPAAAPIAVDDDLDGFETVKSRRRGNRRPVASSSPAVESLLLSSSHPPSRHSLGAAQDLHSLQLTAYSANSLAAQLHLPSALLPLLAAVAGNDYSSAVQETILFRHVQKSSDKIREAAEVIVREWQKAKYGPQLAKKSTPLHRSLESRVAQKNLLALVDDDARSECSNVSSATATPMRNGSPSVADSRSEVSSDPVRRLVEATVTTLLGRADEATHRSTYVSPGEKEACIDSILESMASYSLLTSADPTGSSTFFSRTLADYQSMAVLTRWREAYDAGHFPVVCVTSLAERTAVLTLAPENPDVKTVHVGATRHVRLWTYAILFSVWGMDWARETMAEPPSDMEVEEEMVEVQYTAKSSNGYKEGERPDDVISVDTDSSESEVESMDEDADEEDIDDYRLAQSTLLDAGEAEVKPPPAVKEYVRKGDRLVSDLVEIISLTGLLQDDKEQLSSTLADLQARHAAHATPPSPGHSTEASSDPLPPLAPLLPLPTRLSLYRHALHSDTDSMASLPLSVLPLAASVRHLISCTALETGESKKRFNWTLAEVTSAVLAGCHVSSIYSSRRQHPDVPRSTILEASLWVQPSTRGIHLSSTLQLTLEASHQLAATLLLVPATLPFPHTLFDGPIFQFLLAHRGEVPSQAAGLISEETRALADEVIKVVLEGHEDDVALDAEELKRLRKEKKKKSRNERLGQQADDEAGSEEEQREEEVASARGGSRTQTQAQAQKKRSQNAFELLGGQA